MSNQEAIALLRNLEDALDSYCGLNEEGKTAFRMAIESLELFGNSEQLPSAQPETHEKRTETHACDCISRQATITEIMADLKDRSLHDDPDTPEDYAEGYDEGIRNAAAIVHQMPSAQLNLQPTCNQLATDCISRRDAIDAVCIEWCNVKHQDCKHPFDYEKDDYYWCDGCETVLRTLPDLPSAQAEPEELDFVQPHKKIGVRLEIGQPEQKWTPCSDPSDLPKNERLWITREIYGARIVYDVIWDMTEWSDSVSNVVAYMPYWEPEPYTERREE